MTLLFLDTETGGISTDTSILTLTLTTYRYGKTRIFKKGELDLKLRPDDSIYKINPEALGVNHIDLISHHKEAIPYKEAGGKIYDFLKQEMEGETRKLVLCGQKVSFDIDHVFDEKIISEGTWDTFVDVRHMDTVAIAKFLCLLGIFPESQSISLKNLAKALKINVDETKLHTSAYDNELCAECLFAMKNLFTLPEK